MILLHYYNTSPRKLEVYFYRFTKTFKFDNHLSKLRAKTVNFTCKNGAEKAAKKKQTRTAWVRACLLNLKKMICQSASFAPGLSAFTAVTYCSRLQLAEKIYPAASTPTYLRCHGLTETPVTAFAASLYRMMKP